MIFLYIFFRLKHTLWYTRRSGSNEYPQSMFRMKNKKIRRAHDVHKGVYFSSDFTVYPCKPQFFYKHEFSRTRFLMLTYHIIKEYIMRTCYPDV